MQLDMVKRVVEHDLAAVDFVLKRNLFSRVKHINEVVAYLEKNPGKKIRPLVLILIARALGYTGTRHIYFSVVIELLHMATLLHDDVVDNSDVRRSTLTVNRKWSNQTAILLGDFIYSRAFQLMARLKNPAALSVLADATNILAEGELLQSSNIKNLNITKQEYMRTIECKTAILFSAAAELGAVLGKTSRKVRLVLRAYGQCVGVVYQLVDDLLDYTAVKKNSLGKDVGNDLFEGKITLPLLYALDGNSDLHKFLVNVFKKKNMKNIHPQVFRKVKQVIVKTEVISKVCTLAVDFIVKAKCCVNKIESTDGIFYTDYLKELPCLFLNKVSTIHRSERDLNPRPSA